MEASDIKPRARFGRQGEVGANWYIRSHCMTPTCEMRNEKTGQVLEFGMGGSMAQEFERVKIKQKGNKTERKEIMRRMILNSLRVILVILAMGLLAFVSGCSVSNSNSELLKLRQPVSPFAQKWIEEYGEGDGSVKNYNLVVTRELLKQQIAALDAKVTELEKPIEVDPNAVTMQSRVVRLEELVETISKLTHITHYNENGKMVGGFDPNEPYVIDFSSNGVDPNDEIDFVP